MTLINSNTPTDKRQGKQFSLEVGEVVSVPNDAQHIVTVRRLDDEQGTIGVPALVASKGDIALPSVGDIVIIGFTISNQRVVLGTVYEDNAPAYRRGVRRIGHTRTDSNITIDRNGVIHVTAPFMQLPRVEDDPDVDDLKHGAMWYNETADEYRGCENGSIVSFDTTAV